MSRDNIAILQYRLQREKENVRGQLSHVTILVTNRKRSKLGQPAAGRRDSEPELDGRQDSEIILFFKKQEMRHRQKETQGKVKVKVARKMNGKQHEKKTEHEVSEYY